MEIDVQQRKEQAISYFKEGYNCSQSVLLAFRDILGLDQAAIVNLSSGLGGGVGRMREVCGAFSAMAILAGAVNSPEMKQECSIREANARNYALVQEFAQSFKQECGGSIVCRELLSRNGVDAGIGSNVPSERNETYYAKRPCAQIVGCAAEIIAQKLLYSHCEKSPKL